MIAVWSNREATEATEAMSADRWHHLVLLEDEWVLARGWARNRRRGWVVAKCCVQFSGCNKGALRMLISQVFTFMLTRWDNEQGQLLFLPWEGRVHDARWGSRWNEPVLAGAEGDEASEVGAWNVVASNTHRLTHLDSLNGSRRIRDHSARCFRLLLPRKGRVHDARWRSRRDFVRAGGDVQARKVCTWDVVASNARRGRDPGDGSGRFRIWNGNAGWLQNIWLLDVVVLHVQHPDKVSFEASVGHRYFQFLLDNVDVAIVEVLVDLDQSVEGPLAWLETDVVSSTSITDAIRPLLEGPVLDELTQVGNEVPGEMNSVVDGVGEATFVLRAEAAKDDVVAIGVDPAGH